MVSKMKEKYFWDFGSFMTFANKIIELCISGNFIFLM